MIYKTFFGRYIDLDKVVSISEPRVILNYQQIPFVGFDIICQLVEKPILYEREMEFKTEFTWNVGELHPSIILTNGQAIPTINYIEDKKTVAFKNLSDQIEEIVKEWQKAKTSKQ